MIIPNDTGAPFRLNKFVEYQHCVPPIHPVTLLAYAEHNQIGVDNIVMLAWLISVTYCEITALFLFEVLDWSIITRAHLESFWRREKSRLIFNSARRYAKNMDWVVSLLWDFLALTERQPYAWLNSITGENSLDNYNHVWSAVKEVRYTGRFAADLFLELLMWAYRKKLLPIPFAEPERINWRTDSNITSGLMNVLYLDSEADEFDRSRRVDLQLIPALDRGILNVQKAIRRVYPEQEASLPLVQTKLCSFRNLFKGTRYGGFHHDRQLENLLAYQRNYPDYSLWAEIFEIRKEQFEAGLLGEVGGWTGIRRARKKLWLLEGRTGVED